MDAVIGIRREEIRRVLLLPNTSFYDVDVIIGIRREEIKREGIRRELLLINSIPAGFLRGPERHPLFLLLLKKLCFYSLLEHLFVTF